MGWQDMGHIGCGALDGSCGESARSKYMHVCVLMITDLYDMWLPMYHMLSAGLIGR